MLSPKSEVVLLNVPFTKDKQLDFPSYDKQLEYMLGKVVGTLAHDSLRYADSRTRIEFPVNVEATNGVNYLMYRNKDYGTKWYFAFVVNREWRNNSVCYLDVEIDYFQTYLFDMQLKECLVVREHVVDDSIGANLIDEGIATGEYVTFDRSQTGYFSKFDIIVQTTELIFTDSFQALPSFINKTVNGLNTYVIKNDNNQTLMLSRLTAIILDLQGKGKLDTIVSIFMCPNDYFINTGDEDVATGIIILNNATTKIKQHTVSITPTIKGYTPRNKKLLTYPYTLLGIENNQGNEGVLRFEFMDSKTFNIEYNFGMQGQAICYPISYKGQGMNYSEMLTLGDFPICSWTGSAYQNWASQTKNSRALALATGVGSALVSIPMNNPWGVVGGVSSALGVIAENKDKQTLPNHAYGNTYGGGMTANLMMGDFWFIGKCITVERAKIIDDFFDKYGYKVNRVKTPNFKTRSNYNYVQTQECIVGGYMDGKAKKELENLFNSGVTVWHNASEYGNY